MISLPMETSRPAPAGSLSMNRPFHLRAQHVLLCLLFPSVLLAVEPELPPSHSVQPLLYATGFEFAEGPAFNDAGDLFVVNYRGLGKIGRIVKDGASVFVDLNERAPVARGRAQANGLKVDREGRVIAADASGARLLRIAPDGKQVEVLADAWNGEKFGGLNDVCLDLAGNIYFTDPGGSTLENPIGAVYRWNVADGHVARIAEGLAFPNGLAVSPDQRQLCVAETQKHRLWILDLAATQPAPQRVFIDFPQSDSGEIRGGPYVPDGMVYDEQGRLFVAMYGGGVINVVDPAGKLIRQYDAGGTHATNCHFYGEELFTTAADKEAVFRLPLGVRGFNYRGQP